MFERIHEPENLLEAYRRAAKGKRGLPNVAHFEHRLEDQLIRLHHELESKTYRPLPYVSFTIHEPKRRLISAAAFRDRVVHHALCNVIEPVFERSFIFDSYANRIGKGTHRCLNRCQQFARHHPYCLQCDVRRFFPSLDHEILKQNLFRKITDPDVQWLVTLILDGGTGILDAEYEMVWFPGDDLLAATRLRGLPIGNLTSQFWANCQMNPFDHFVKRELGCKAYLRYVDDFMLFAESKAQLWEWKQRLVDKLAELRLTIHAGAHPRPVGEGIPFLGFVVYPDRRRLKRRNAVNFSRRLRGKINLFHAGNLEKEAVQASVQAWDHHARYGNTTGLRKCVLAEFGQIG